MTRRGPQDSGIIWIQIAKGISSPFTVDFRICTPVSALIIIVFAIFVIVRDELHVRKIDSQLNLVDAHTHRAITSTNLQVAVAVSIAVMSMVFIETAIDLLFIKYELRAPKNVEIQYLLLVGSCVVIGGSAVIITYCVWGKHVMAYWYITCFTQAFLAACSFDITLIVADWNRFSVLFCSTLVTVSHILRALAVTDCARSKTIIGARTLSILALIICSTSFIHHLYRLKLERKRKIYMEQKMTTAKITMDESISIFTQIVSILYCLGVTIRSFQYGPFCARHLSRELASGWMYASSLLFLALSIVHSRFQLTEVTQMRLPTEKVCISDLEENFPDSETPLTSSKSCKF